MKTVYLLVIVLVIALGADMVHSSYSTEFSVKMDKMYYNNTDIAHIIVLGPPSTQANLAIVDSSSLQKFATVIHLDSNGTGIFSLNLTSYGYGIYTATIGGGYDSVKTGFGVGILPTESGGMILFSSQKYEYIPSGTIQIQGNVRPISPVKMELIDPYDINESSIQVTSDGSGIFQANMTIPNDAVNGTWKINASSGLNHSTLYIIVISQNLHEKPSKELNEKLEIAKDKMSDMMMNNTIGIPLNLVGVDVINSTLDVGIDNTKATLSAEQYIEKIKQIVGNIPIKIIFGQNIVDSGNDTYNSMQQDSPLKQFKSGVVAKNVTCEQDLSLIFKSEDGTPACVKPDTVIPLTMRGWTIEPANQEIVYFMKSNSTAQIFVKFTARHWEGPGPAQPISINPRFYVPGASPEYPTDAINATVTPNSVYSNSDTIVTYTITSQDTPSGIYWLLIDDACSTIPIAVNLELPQITSSSLQSPTASLNCPSSAMPYQIVGVNGTTAEFVPH